MLFLFPYIESGSDHYVFMFSCCCVKIRYFLFKFGFIHQNEFNDIFVCVNLLINKSLILLSRAMVGIVCVGGGMGGRLGHLSTKIS
jgi:hypothetical protein